MIIQLLSSLLDGYRLFDLNIPRTVLLQQTQVKYDRTLEKLRQEVKEEMVGLEIGNVREEVDIECVLVNLGQCHSSSVCSSVLSLVGMVLSVPSVVCRRDSTSE